MIRRQLAGAGLAFTMLAGSSLLPAGAGAQEQVTIGVSIPAATHGWTGGVNYHAKEAVDRLGKLYPSLKFQLVTASDPGKQANDLEDLVSVHRVDALVILHFESGPVKRVKESGAFITVVDRGLEEPGIEDVYVAGNNSEFGRVSGEYLREKLGGKGNVVVLRGIPTVIDNQRVEGFQQAIEGSDIKVLDMKHANWNRDQAYEVMQDYLSRFPQIDAVWASDDDMALGVIEAVRQAGREDQLFILGGAGMKQMIERVQQGDKLIPADVLYPPAMIATAIEVTALKYTAKVPIEGRYILGSPLITAENADQYYYPDSPF
jgi:ribose transport system substrate-binding protein